MQHQIIPTRQYKLGIMQTCGKNYEEYCLRDQTWLCVYCWCQTPEGVVSPRRAITRAQPDCLVLYIFTTALRHPIFNSLLIPATACEPQAIACDIKVSLELLGIGVNCILKENIFSMHWSISFLN